MIISRAPLRITLGGGGTDLPAYYESNGGHWVSAAIDRYMHIILYDRSIEDAVKLKYSKTEVVNDIAKIEHRVFREVLEKYGIKKSIEMVSIADVGAGTGLGSSGSFTVALLNAVHKYKGIEKTRQELAEEAFEIERKTGGGKQDPYIAAYGGIKSFSVSIRGRVEVTNVAISEPATEELENSLLLFFTKYSRSSQEILERQGRKMKGGENYAMNKISLIGYNSLTALENGWLEVFGKSLSEHWEAKRAIEGAMSNAFLDEVYEAGMESGATGGKLIGAGGGGFFMFYCDKKKEALRKAMDGLGLKEMKFKFDFEGAKVMEID